MTCLIFKQNGGLQNVPPALRLRHPRVSQRAVRRCTEASISGADFLEPEKNGTSSSRKTGIVMGHKSERDSYGSGIF